MTNMTLSTLQAIALSMAAATAAMFAGSFILRTVFSMKSRPALSKDVEITTVKRGNGLVETVGIDADDMKSAAKKLDRLMDMSRVMLYAGTILAGSAMVLMFIFSKYNSMALRHGAFDDYKDTETIASIKDTSSHMFLDQSKDLPEDLSGSIVIFFKYTCSDCYDTHDQIMLTLEKEGAQNVWFVSSRSEKGKALIEKYGVDAVPWALYVKEGNELGASDIIYDEFEKDDPSAKYKEENLIKIINAQKGIETE